MPPSPPSLAVSIGANNGPSGCKSDDDCLPNRLSRKPRGGLQSACLLMLGCLHGLRAVKGLWCRVGSRRLICIFRRVWHCITGKHSHGTNNAKAPSFSSRTLRITRGRWSRALHLHVRNQSVATTQAPISSSCCELGRATTCQQLFRNGHMLAHA